MEEKTKKITLWKITKWTLMLISILVYALAFTRIFVSCDANISDDIILTSQEKRDFDNLDKDYPLYNYQPLSWTSDDGTVQIKNIYYLEPIQELQLTLRYRISTYEKEKGMIPFYCKIRVTEGDEEITFENLETHFESRYNYGYIRLCIDGIVIDDGKKVTSKAQRVDDEGNVTYETVTEIVGGNKVSLDIYDAGTDELLFTFSIAGKPLEGVRTRRNKVDTRIIE